MSNLAARYCIPCEGKTVPMSEQVARSYLEQLPEWELDEAGTEINRTFRFKDHYRTIAFVNAVAWISHQEEHHPVSEIGYNYCTVHYSTHAIHGLSDNDFICAAKLDELLERQYRAFD